EELAVEATGETVGEAKWAALRELERLVPDLDRDAVRFEILSEGQRGLLGVGYAPARVVAKTAVARGEAAAGRTAVAAREVVERIAAAIGADVRMAVSERAGVLTVTCSGPGVGLLIGRRGQTIDAIQYLANAVVRGVGGETPVVVDAAGYRERRRAALAALADRSARKAAATGRRVELEPMTAVERKIVHESLKDDPEVETVSEGSEPNRYVVVLPRRAAV
ncbi:MAG TPA: RNA-binding cell elongation regulator Jag/EloR, partial [Gaiellaceae bacterium]|nr:RNA-binding cell elongation regulator Jag/EloR [Gaiellaceae bacterium]